MRGSESLAYLLAVLVIGCGSSDRAGGPSGDASDAGLPDVTHETGLLEDAGGGDSEGEAGDGFEPYFNGVDLAGFEYVGITADALSIEDGVLKCTCQSAGYFYRNEVFENFVLDLEFRFERPPGLAPGADDTFTGNSGYFVYLSPPHQIWPRCLEVQGSYPETGDIFGLPGLTPANDQLDLAALAQAKKPVGDWNRLVVSSDAGALRVELNGLVVNQSGATDISQGLIALESEGAEIHWRNVRVKRLP